MIKFNKTKTVCVLLALILATGIVTGGIAGDGYRIEASDFEVFPGGVPFGIKMYTDGLLIIGFSPVEGEAGPVTPAIDAGLKAGDVITKINGNKIITAEEFISVIEKGEGDVEITFTRDGKEMTTRVSPSLSVKDNKYKTGIWLRDSTAGIGTMTYVIPESLEFGGLGHGICDTESGKLIPLMRGVVADVKISGVKKGEAGTPGELHGYFSNHNCGTILKNTPSGVFGILKDSFKEVTEGEKIPLGTKDDVNVGNAIILSTVDGSGRCEYGITITRVPETGENSSFEIEIIDSSLLEKTGGIVQGMSGSPIIQDGKLVGAVTHVLVNDPTRGYGIFIENMLETAS